LNFAATQIGCNVNAADRYNFTPLHYAACSGFIDGVDALLRFGADVLIKGGETNSVTPKDVAQARGNLDVVDLLGMWERKANDPVNVKVRRRN